MLSKTFQRISVSYIFHALRTQQIALKRLQILLLVRHCQTLKFSLRAIRPRGAVGQRRNFFERSTKGGVASVWDHETPLEHERIGFVFNCVCVSDGLLV